MEEFEKLKEEILSRARKADACEEQYKTAYNATTAKVLCDVIKNNFSWCCENDVIDGKLIDDYKELFGNNDILHNESLKEGYCIVDGFNWICGYGKSKVFAYENSVVSAHNSCFVSAHGNSKINAYDYVVVEAYDNSKVFAEMYSSVFGFNNSKITLRNWAHGSVTHNAVVEAYNDSHVMANGNSNVTAYGNSIVKADNQSMIHAYDHSIVKARCHSYVQAADDSYVICLSKDVKCELTDNAICWVNYDGENIIRYYNPKLKIERYE